MNHFKRLMVERNIDSIRKCGDEIAAIEGESSNSQNAIGSSGVNSVSGKKC